MKCIRSVPPTANIDGSVGFLNVIIPISYFRYFTLFRFREVSRIPIQGYSDILNSKTSLLLFYILYWFQPMGFLYETLYLFWIVLVCIQYVGVTYYVVDFTHLRPSLLLLEYKISKLWMPFFLALKILTRSCPFLRMLQSCVTLHHCNARIQRLYFFSKDGFSYSRMCHCGRG